MEEQAEKPGKGMRSIVIMLVTMLVIVGIYMALQPSSKPASPAQAQANMQVYAERAVRDRLKDPGSAQFSNFRYVKGKAACGTVNARGGFGGYVGPQRFIYLGKDVGAAMEQDMDAHNFDELWRQVCP